MKHLQPFDEFVNEEALNEGDMTKLYDGFIVLDTKNQKQYKFKYVKGVKNVRIEDEAIAKLMKTTGLSRGNFGVYGFVKKGEWNDSEAEVLENLTNEGAMSDLDLMAREAKDFNAFVKEFTKKYHDLSNAGEPGQFKNWLKSIYDTAKMNEAIELNEGITTTPSWREANPSVDKLVNDIKKIILRQVSPANIFAMFTIVDGQPTLLINDKNSKLSSYLDLKEVHNLLDKNNMSEEELRIVFK